MLLAHAAWSQQFKAATGPTKKSFRVLDAKGSPRQAENVDIQVIPDPAPADGTTAEHGGWQVSVAYTNAPTVSLFQQTYQDQQTANKVMEDLCLAAATVEGFLKQEDFTKAAEATKAFLDKCSANSGSTPIAPTETK